MRAFRLLVATLVMALIVPVVLVISPALASAVPGSVIATLATENIGKKACSTNSSGGKGYDTSCAGNGGQPEYWCADFARWVWAEAGVADTASLSSAAGSFYIYGEKFGTLSATPAVGDAVVFGYNGAGAADHVAIVTQANPNGTIETVSGDWNGDSGSEAQFASTSSVVSNTPAYLGALGSTPAVMGMTISAYVLPVGADVVPIMGGTTLSADKTLTSGEELTSPNGQYGLIMQSTGNLVEYMAGRALWSTPTEGDNGDHAVMQSDGNLVVYSSTAQALWSSGTGGHPSGAFVLVLQDDAALAINGPSGELWSVSPPTGVLSENEILRSGQVLVSPNGLYALVMQSAGNLVEYTGGRPLWWTPTDGDIGDRVVMQSDGNLVIYSSTGKALWDSGTGGHPAGAFALVLQDDAALVVTGPSGELWSNDA